MKRHEKRESREERERVVEKLLCSYLARTVIRVWRSSPMLRLGWRFCAHPAERHWQGASLCASLQQGDVLSKRAGASLSGRRMKQNIMAECCAKSVCTHGYLTSTEYTSCFHISQLTSHVGEGLECFSYPTKANEGLISGLKGKNRKLAHVGIPRFLHRGSKISAFTYGPTIQQAWDTQNARLLFKTTLAFSIPAKSSHSLAKHTAHWFGTDWTGARGQPYAART